MVGHLAASGVPIDVQHQEVVAAGQGEIDSVSTRSPGSRPNMKDRSAWRVDGPGGRL